MGYNDLTAPHQGLNDEWNDKESSINTEEGTYNDLTISTQNTPGDGSEWNDEM